MTGARCWPRSGVTMGENADHRMGTAWCQGGVDPRAARQGVVTTAQCIRGARVGGSVTDKHICEPGYDIEREEHVFPTRGFGVAVIRCYEDEQGRLWVTNDEYETRVNFCPFCGYQAKSQVKDARRPRGRCYLRGLTLLGIFNTVCGCLFGQVLVRVTDTGKTVRWYWDAAVKHPPEAA